MSTFSGAFSFFVNCVSLIMPLVTRALPHWKALRVVFSPSLINNTRLFPRISLSRLAQQASAAQVGVICAIAAIACGVLHLFISNS